VAPAGAVHAGGGLGSGARQDSPVAHFAARERAGAHRAAKIDSWLDAVEGIFAKLTKRRPKRGAFGSLVDLQAAIHRFLAETNDNPKPFVWTADPDKIIAAVKRGYQTLDFMH
jgi:hypothetical protein